jgi:hypothetical protein
MECTIPKGVTPVTKCARELQNMGNLLLYSVCDKKAAVGTVRHLQVQQKVGISLSSNGREKMDVPDIVILVPLQQKVGISPFSNG